MFHNYHILGSSIYSFLVFMVLFGLVSSVLIWFKYGLGWMVLCMLVVLVYLVVLWGKDIVGEGLGGCHTSYVKSGLKMGFMLFVFSEFMFFVGVFWVFFDSSLVPSMVVGDYSWSYGVELVNPYDIPLLNTLILLSSGVSVTWSHNNLLSDLNSFWGMAVTLGLSVLFTLLQFKEYSESMFSISDGIYGSVFYLSTGFHGFHVICGTLFLAFSWVMMMMNKVNSESHLGFESAIVYWHFVDVVWLFLFSFVYLWVYE